MTVPFPDNCTCLWRRLVTSREWSGVVRVDADPRAEKFEERPASVVEETSESAPKMLSAVVSATKALKDRPLSTIIHISVKGSGVVGAKEAMVA